MKDRDNYGRFIKSHKSGMTGKKQSAQMKRKIGKKLKGHKFWGVEESLFKKGERVSPETEFKKGQTPWNKGKKMSLKSRKKMREAKLKNPTKYWFNKKRPCIAKEKHYCWKGGITPINEKIRKSIEYRRWREEVFTRDDYTCQTCDKRGGKIHAHHLREFGKFKKLRFILKNGITLCVACHLKIHRNRG